MVKKLFFLLCLATICLQMQGQSTENKKGIPPFTILLTNGNRFSYANLVRNKPLMLIYFAPDCEHCRDFIKQLTAEMHDLKKTGIILISYLPLRDLQKFNKEFGLDQFPNIKVGTEGNSFVVPAYFKIVKFPFIALYNSAAKLVAIFRDTPSLKLLLEYTKKL